MRTSTADPAPREEGGFASLSYVVAATFALWFFAILANLIVMQYGSGVVRLALDEGARRGAVAGSDAVDCEVAIDDALSDLLGGEYGERISRSCVDAGGWMTASATATFGGFIPPVPDLTFDFEASVARESFGGGAP